MVYDIDIHELNLGPFKGLQVLDEISLKKCVCFLILNNKCITIYSFWISCALLISMLMFKTNSNCN
jgi:hypothetical protein